MRHRFDKLWLCISSLKHFQRNSILLSVFVFWFYFFIIIKLLCFDFFFFVNLKSFFSSKHFEAGFFLLRYSRLLAEIICDRWDFGSRWKKINKSFWNNNKKLYIKQISNSLFSFRRDYTSIFNRVFELGCGDFAPSVWCNSAIR